MVAWLAEDATRFSPEYESCRQLADRHGVSLKEVYDAAQRAYRA
jgi:uncharacterized protein (DUF111 family)